MTLSANSLYHYTTDYRNIESILKTGFRYSVLDEKVAFSTFPDSPFYIKDIINYRNILKAVCFCDIPLKFCDNHREQYGNYVISLSKEWGIEKGITPIRYIHFYTPDINNDSYRMMRDIVMLYSQHNGQPFDAILNLLIMGGAIEKPSEEELNNLPEFAKKLFHYINDYLLDVTDYIHYSKSFLRDYEGEWTDRVTKNKVNRRFYDEKEWRSVATEESNENLMFELSDISEIIVVTKDEKDNLTKFISEELESDSKRDFKNRIKLWSNITSSK